MKENSREKTINLNNEEKIALNNRIIDLETKIEKKDKIIDKMAEFINKQDIDEEICKNNTSDLCDEFGTGINCIKCIKQYFENKVKGENN